MPQLSLDQHNTVSKSVISSQVYLIRGAVYLTWANSAPSAKGHWIPPWEKLFVADVLKNAFIRKCRIHSFCRQAKALMIRLVMPAATKLTDNILISTNSNPLQSVLKFCVPGLKVSCHSLNLKNRCLFLFRALLCLLLIAMEFCCTIHITTILEQTGLPFLLWLQKCLCWISFTAWLYECADRFSMWLPPVWPGPLSDKPA